MARLLPAPLPNTGLNNATGFSASGLPTGLSINPTTGAITGQTTAVGDHNITLTASNLSGSSQVKISSSQWLRKNLYFNPEVANPTNLSGLKLWLDSSDSTKSLQMPLLLHCQLPLLEVGKTKVETIIMLFNQPINQPSTTSSGIQFDGSNDSFTLTNDISEANLNIFFVLQGHGFLYANNGTERTLFTTQDLDANFGLG